MLPISCSLPALNLTDSIDLVPGEGCTSESGVAMMEEDAESSEMSERTLPVVQQSPPLDERDSQTEEGDQGAKGSSESVGSGSSFEELDMDIDEEKEREDVEKDHVEDNEKRGIIEGELNEG